jgi:hypothetical protein
MMARLAVDFYQVDGGYLYVHLGGEAEFEYTLWVYSAGCPDLRWDDFRCVFGSVCDHRLLVSGNLLVRDCPAVYERHSVY